MSHGVIELIRWGSLCGGQQFTCARFPSGGEGGLPLCSRLSGAASLCLPLDPLPPGGDLSKGKQMPAARMQDLP